MVVKNANLDQTRKIFLKIFWSSKYSDTLYLSNFCQTLFYLFTLFFGVNDVPNKNHVSIAVLIDYYYFYNRLVINYESPTVTIIG